jgi:hypothetical protein
VAADVPAVPSASGELSLQLKPYESPVVLTTPLLQCSAARVGYDHSAALPGASNHELRGSSQSLMGSMRSWQRIAPSNGIASYQSIETRRSNAECPCFSIEKS